jgi:hypothetical protein
MGYTVLVDTREQTPWEFAKRGDCDGWEQASLRTGDYTLKGFEGKFVVERKGSTPEIAKNLCEARFERELQRMSEFPLAFVVCEFTYDDLFVFPNRTLIPAYQKKRLRVTGQFLVRRLAELEVKYPVKWCLAGPRAREWVSSLFKRVVEAHVAESGSQD